MPIDAMRETEDLVAFEGRAAGTDAERRAARHLEQRLEALGREVESEPTSIHPNFAITHAIHALMAIVGSVLSVTVPAAGAGLVLLATVSAFGDLTGSFLLVRRLTGRRASQNVTSAEGGDKPAVVVLTAHYDAPRGGAIFSRRAYESPVGPFAVFFWSMFAILLCTIPRVVGFEGVGLTVVQFIPTVVLIASLPLLVDVALSPPARGANDNASGVATVLRLAERYGGKLEHFDVWVVFPGADKALLLGTREWLKRHKGELDPEVTVFVNVEAAGAGTERWVEKDGLVVSMRYHPTLVELCENLGDGRAMRSRDGTTALAARAAGYPAITIGARNARDHAPDRVDADALELTYDFCCALLERLDDSIGPELA
jgi:Peptidase family M28